MGLRGILRNDSGEVREDDFVEVEHFGTHDASAVPIRISKINDYGDVEPVQKLVREGNIVLVKIKGLKDKDMSELKRAVERLRKTVIAVNGDIAGVDENFIIATPNFARVAREDQQQPGQPGAAPGPAGQPRQGGQTRQGGNQQQGPASRR